MTRYPYKEEIEREAYMLWEKAGKPEGRDLEFWEKAKTIHGKKNFKLPWFVRELPPIVFANLSGIERIYLRTETEAKIDNIQQSLDEMRKEF